MDLSENTIIQLNLYFSTNLDDSITNLHKLARRMKELQKEGFSLENFELFKESSCVLYTFQENISKPVQTPLNNNPIKANLELLEKLTRPISSLGFSKRINSCFENYGRLKGQVKIKSAGDLVERSETYILRNIKGLGPRSLREIKEALSKIGLSFGMDISYK